MTNEELGVLLDAINFKITSYEELLQPMFERHEEVLGKGDIEEWYGFMRKQQDEYALQVSARDKLQEMINGSDRTE